VKENAAIEIRALTVAYDTKPVLWNIDLIIPKGKLVAIIGPNGAGKTTLIKSMLGLVKPLFGTIDFDCNGGKSKIAYVPQNGCVDWDFPATVLEIVMMGRYRHLGWFKHPKKEDKQMALDTLEKVGMHAYAHRQINQLSGGQQQRIFLARALIQDADIYFLDEPFKGVDAQTEKVIIRLLKQLRAQGKTAIIVHHDLQTVSDYFDWVALINLQLVASGSVKDVFLEENLKTTYEGICIPSKEGSTCNL